MLELIRPSAVNSPSFRANRWSLCVASFISPPPPPPTRDSPLLPHRTCASKPLSPTRPSPPPNRVTPRPGGTQRAGATRGSAPPASRRTARPATRYRDRSSPAGTCPPCSGWRGPSSPRSSWASSRVRTAPPSPGPPAPGCPTSTTWRRRLCNGSGTRSILLLDSNATKRRRFLKFSTCSLLILVKPSKPGRNGARKGGPEGGRLPLRSHGAAAATAAEKLGEFSNSDLW